MKKKLYPNEICPCGSGKKYKNCCGGKSKAQNYSSKESELVLEDFVKEQLSKDISFLANALQLIIGPYGYNYCETHKKEMQEEYKKDRFESFVKRDGLQVYETTENTWEKNKIKDIRPYGGEVPEVLEDIFTLLKKEHICIEARQVDLFHAYVIDNLEKRFDDYLYIPNKECMKGQKFGAFARRGYDFLLTITLYLELQLGIPMYLYIMNPWKIEEKYLELYRNYFSLKDVESNEKMYWFLIDYMNVIETISQKYNAKEEIELYQKIGAYTEEEYKGRLNMIKEIPFHYIQHLCFLVSATCFNRSGFYDAASVSFPQCDMVKYMVGLEKLIALFEEKTEREEIDPVELFGEEVINQYEEKTGENLKKEILINDQKEIYDQAVFYWMDELNGQGNAIKTKDLNYLDSSALNADEYTMVEGKRCVNPAKKTTRITKIRRLRMELYQMLNGQFFTLYVGNVPGEQKNLKLVGKYPMLPWLSNGTEPTIHCKPFDKQPKNIEDLYSADIRKRQEYLTMEYRMTEIPVNCIEEYLNPQIFLNWKERNDLLKETKRQNEQLRVMNEELKRHMALNQELVRSLSHSSANYLNSDKLVQTGVSLQKADGENPTVENLHLEGLTLLLQAEQEMYLSRQLNSLVWRCSGDVSTLREQIRSGVSKEDGLSVLEPVEFSLKTVLARVLFREGVPRSEFIKEKLQKTEEEWLFIKSSFMLDVLAGEKDITVVEWWNRYIGKLSITCSKQWEKVLLIKDKPLYDLIMEITTEQIFNALSHGDVTQPIVIEFGQAEERRGRPSWVYILCKNAKGKEFPSGRGVGISTLNETILLLNSNKRGLETKIQEEEFCSKAWLLPSFLRAL